GALGPRRHPNSTPMSIVSKRTTVGMNQRVPFRMNQPPKLRTLKPLGRHEMLCCASTRREWAVTHPTRMVAALARSLLGAGQVRRARRPRMEKSPQIDERGLDLEYARALSARGITQRICGKWARDTKTRS